MPVPFSRLLCRRKYRKRSGSVGGKYEGNDRGYEQSSCMDSCE